MIRPNQKLALYCTVQSEVFREQCWLYSLTAAGRKDLRYLSFTHLGCISLLLKELPSAVKVTCGGLLHQSQ